MAELTVTATLDNLDAIQAMVEAEAESIDSPMKSIVQLQLAVEEAFVNVSRYAYAPSTGMVRITCVSDQDSGTISVTLCDRGVPFDPLSREEPDITLSAEERPIGGLGIHLIRKNTDTQEYSREGDRNVLRFTKNML